MTGAEGGPAASPSGRLRQPPPTPMADAPQPPTTPAGPVFRLALAVNLGLCAAHLLFWLPPATQGTLWRSDFVAFYRGAALVLDGRGDRLYDRGLQAEYQDRAVPERAGREGL